MSLLTYDRFYQEIRSEKMNRLIDEIRNGHPEKKRELFAVTWQASFRDGKRSDKNAIPTGLYMLDIDNLSPSLFPTVGNASPNVPLPTDVCPNGEGGPTPFALWTSFKDRVDELDIIMVHCTPSGCGLRVVAMCRPEFDTIAENQKWLAEQIGTEYDAVCRDWARMSFLSKEEDFYYIRPDLLDVKIQKVLDKDVAAQKELEQGKKVIDEMYGVEPNCLSSSNESLPPLGGGQEGGCEGSGSEVTAFASSAFDLCVQQAGLSADQMDVWGEHNWHTNLMAAMSVGMPKLMSREQLRAVVAVKLPNYSQTEDCQKLIDYFYDNYSAGTGYMSTSLREINAQAQKVLSPFGGSKEGADDDSTLDELVRDYNPPAMPKKLPRLVELEVRDYDSRYRESLAQTSAVGHSGIASHFRAEYLNNKTLGPALMVSVMGGSGTGKDYCTNLFNDQMKHTLDDSDNKEWEKVRVNAELREKMRNAKECPPKYHPKIRVFENASKTSLLELQTNLGENGMLVGIFSETDSFVGSAGAGWSNISVMLRKGFSGEKTRQYYMAESTCNTNTSMNISMLMEGTPKTMLERMFNERNCENGTMQRFAPVLMPKTKRTFRPPKQNYLTDDERQERDALLLELYQKDLALGDETLLLDAPKTNNAIGLWFDELEERYNDGLITDAEADLSRRCGEFMLRAAIPLIALYGETKEVVDYAVWFGKMAYYNMCYIYGHRVQANMNASNELLKSHTDARQTAVPLLDKLPEVFTLQQFKELREREGQSSDVKTLLSRYCKKGRLERTGRGVYKKVKN